MRILTFISNLMIPILLFYIIGYGLLSRRDIYRDFLDGAADGLKTAVGICCTYRPYDCSRNSARVGIP